MRVENEIKCFYARRRLYLAIKIYFKELNKLLFCSGLMKANGCLNYDHIHKIWISYYKSCW